MIRTCARFLLFRRSYNSFWIALSKSFLLCGSNINSVCIFGILKGDSSLLSPKGCKRVTLCRQFFKMKIKTHKIKLNLQTLLILKSLLHCFYLCSFCAVTQQFSGKVSYFLDQYNIRNIFADTVSKIVSLWRSLFSYGLLSRENAPFLLLLYISLSFRKGGKKILLEQPRNR